MRQIKFRAKNLANEWAYGDLHLNCSKPHLHMDNWTTFSINTETIGQCTGLLDKNGKEIYEGDILKVYAYTNNGQGETYDFREEFTVEELKGEFRYDFISVVNFNEGGFYLSEHSGCDTSLCILFGDMRHSFPIFECEVIGNVHDNPELTNS